MKRIVFYVSLAIILLSFPSHGFSQLEGVLDQQQITRLADGIAQAGKKRIAVVDFTDLQGNVTELGRFLAEEVSVALAGPGKGFEVIDRVHLKSILAEHKLALTGVIDPGTARQLGKIAGVDAIVTGSITPFGDNIRISFKVLDTETAMIIAASSGSIARTAAINELLAKGIEPSAPVTSPPRMPSKHLIKAHNFTFELTKAEASGENVTCYLLITNNDPRDRTLYVSTSSRISFIIDNLGNKYGSRGGRLGTQSSTDGSSGQLLVSGIPTSATINFNISSKAHMIALLQIGCGGEQSFEVQFRNIPLTR